MNKQKIKNILFPQQGTEKWFFRIYIAFTYIIISFVSVWALILLVNEIREHGNHIYIAPHEVRDAATPLILANLKLKKNDKYNSIINLSIEERFYKNKYTRLVWKEVDEQLGSDFVNTFPPYAFYNERTLMETLTELQETFVYSPNYFMILDISSTYKSIYEEKKKQRTKEAAWYSLLSVVLFPLSVLTSIFILRSGIYRIMLFISRHANKQKNKKILFPQQGTDKWFFRLYILLAYLVISAFVLLELFILGLSIFDNLTSFGWEVVGFNLLGIAGIIGSFLIFRTGGHWALIYICFGNKSNQE